jgi:hypothetical protein
MMALFTGESMMVNLFFYQASSYMRSRKSFAFDPFLGS